jgi:hydrogenase-4 membrane subunit HyfE
VALYIVEANQVMAPGANTTAVVQAIAEWFVGLFVAATMGFCQGVIGVAGGASLCCTGGDCPVV